MLDKSIGNPTRNLIFRYRRRVIHTNFTKHDKAGIESQIAKYLGRANKFLNAFVN